MGVRAGRAGVAATIGAVALASLLAIGWAAGTRSDAESARPSSGASTVSPAAGLATVTAPAAEGDPEPDAAAVVPPERCSGTRGRAVLVDLSEQQLWLCRRGSTVGSSPVTTGSDEHPTPTGTWSVYAKQTGRWLSGEGYSRQVDHWMPFFRGYGFHDSSWQEIPYGSELVHEDGSHGCVHVPAAMMERLYDWARVGTDVRIAA